MRVKRFSIFILVLFIGLIFLIDCVNRKQEKKQVTLESDIITFMEEEQMYNKLTENEKQEGWRLLFDGETTKGWRGFMQDTIGEGWVVRDGNLVTLGKGGDLGGDIITEEQFENFELKLEWKISQGGNSGIFFHVVEGDYPTVYATGPEYQIIDDISFPEKLENRQTSGSNYAMHPPRNAKIKPVGEWNSSRILVNQSHVEHWLNEIKVVEYTLWTEEWNELVKKSKWKDYPDYGMAKKGHISLQDHGSMIWFRNIKIRVL